jgi:hypothetical protein
MRYRDYTSHQPHRTARAIARAAVALLVIVPVAVALIQASKTSLDDERAAASQCAEYGIPASPANVDMMTRYNNGTGTWSPEYYTDMDAEEIASQRAIDEIIRAADAKRAAGKLDKASR